MARSKIEELTGSGEMLTLREMTKAHDAGAKGNWKWLENYSRELLGSTISPNPVLIPQSKLGLLSEFQQGLNFLRTQRIHMGTIDMDDVDMAKPMDAIKTTFGLSGLISGLRLNPNGGIEGNGLLSKDDSLEWAKWCRLGYSLAAKNPNEIPSVDKKLRIYISSHSIKTT